MDFVRSLTTMIALFSLVLLAAASAGAVPKPPPRFWGVSRCEQTLQAYGDVEGGNTVDGHGFHIGLAVCVGAGGPRACKSTPDRRSRLYSRFTVLARSPDGTGRSFTLATRPGLGLVQQRHIYGASNKRRTRPDARADN